jgi:hypothetical protein
VWCGEVPLKEAFPVLYDIARDKDALVADHLVVESESYQWDVSFFWAAHDWEVDVLASFFSLLHPEWIMMGRISYGGLLLTKGNLMLDLFIRLLLAKRLFIFLGKVSGGPRFLRKWLSLLGRQRMGRSLLWTISGRSGS